MSQRFIAAYFRLTGLNLAKFDSASKTGASTINVAVLAYRSA
jgi:hypothetical protein